MSWKQSWNVPAKDHHYLQHTLTLWNSLMWRYITFLLCLLWRTLHPVYQLTSCHSDQWVYKHFQVKGQNCEYISVWRWPGVFSRGVDGERGLGGGVEGWGEGWGLRDKALQRFFCTPWPLCWGGGRSCESAWPELVTDGHTPVYTPGQTHLWGGQREKTEQRGLKTTTVCSDNILFKVQIYSFGPERATHQCQCCLCPKQPETRRECPCTDSWGENGNVSYSRVPSHLYMTIGIYIYNYAFS